MTNGLIQQVKRVNRQAALFMVKKVPLLVQRGKLHSTREDAEDFTSNPTEHLPSAFVFRNTPQGSHYWNKNSHQLPSPYGW